MKYRRVGDTDLRLSEIGFGCGGNAGLMIRGSRREQVGAIARAMELGINYFDNAPDYGDGIAESNLGHALAELGAHPILNSKVEVRAENLESIADHISESVEQSLLRMGVDHLDVLQIHNAPTAARPDLNGRGYSHLWIEDYLRPDGVADGIHRLSKDGKIRYAGFICRGNDADEAMTLLDTGLFHVINVAYTLLNPSAGMMIPESLCVTHDFDNVITRAKSKGAGVAVYSPLAGGWLSDEMIAGYARHPLAKQATPEFQLDAREKAATLEFLAHETGLSLSQAAYRFILMHEGVATALGGFSSLSQIESIAAVSGLAGFDEHLMARLFDLWCSNFRLGG